MRHTQIHCKQGSPVNPMLRANMTTILTRKVIGAVQQRGRLRASGIEAYQAGTPQRLQLVRKTYYGSA